MWIWIHSDRLEWKEDVYMFWKGRIKEYMFYLVFSQVIFNNDDIILIIVYLNNNIICVVNLL